MVYEQVVDTRRLSCAFTIAVRRKAQSLKEGAAQASSRHRFRFKFCYV